MYWLSVSRMCDTTPRLSARRRFRVRMYGPDSAKVGAEASEVIDHRVYAWLRDNVRAAQKAGDLFVSLGFFDGFYVHLTAQGLRGVEME